MLAVPQPLLCCRFCGWQQPYPNTVIHLQTTSNPCNKQFLAGTVHHELVVDNIHTYDMYTYHNPATPNTLDRLKATMASLSSQVPFTTTKCSSSEPL